MYKASSTSFSHVEKVEDQVLELCMAESGDGGSQCRAAVAEEDEADVGAVEEEIGVDDGEGDRCREQRRTD
jgi:hypothetical protein